MRIVHVSAVVQKRKNIKKTYDEYMVMKLIITRTLYTCLLACVSLLPCSFLTADDGGAGKEPTALKNEHNCSFSRVGTPVVVLLLLCYLKWKG